MALHYRKRGDVWHCRGSIRIGRNAFPVREFSTGCTSKIEALAVGAAEEARIRAEFLDTGTVSEPLRVITIRAEEFGVTVRSLRSVSGVDAERVSGWGRRPMVVMGLGTASYDPS